MANGNNATIGFEKQIWDAACVLWGHIPAAEYRKVIVGLIFLRYISNAFEKRYQELVAEGDGFEDDRDAYAEDNIFFVPEDARWSKIASAAHTPEIGTLIDNAMRAIEAENKSLKNVLPKNYASPDLDKRVLGDVVDLFTNMDRNTPSCIFPNPSSRHGISTMGCLNNWGVKQDFTEVTPGICCTTRLKLCAALSTGNWW